MSSLCDIGSLQGGRYPRSKQSTLEPGVPVRYHHESFMMSCIDKRKTSTQIWVRAWGCVQHTCVHVLHIVLKNQMPENRTQLQVCWRKESFEEISGEHLTHAHTYKHAGRA